MTNNLLADRAAFQLVKPFLKSVAELEVRLADVEANLQCDASHQLAKRQILQLCMEIEHGRRALNLKLLRTDDAVRHANSSIITLRTLDAILEQALLAIPRSED